MKFSLSKLIALGIVVEIALFVISYMMQPSLEETFRHAARYSGRLSFGIFLVTFYKFAFGYPKALKNNITLRNCLTLFAINHIIHFGFLATNIYLNDIPIVPIKLLGGFLAYLMIVIAPFVLHKLKLALQLVYFYYVCVVMIVTYVARAKGDFEGVTPFWFHFFALGVLISCSLFFAWKLYSASTEKNN